VQKIDPIECKTKEALKGI